MRSVEPGLVADADAVVDRKVCDRFLDIGDPIMVLRETELQNLPERFFFITQKSS